MQPIIELIQTKLDAATNPLDRQMLENLLGEARLVADVIAGGGDEHVGGDDAEPHE